MMPKFDAWPGAQVDVEKDAKRVPEITVAFESVRRRKQQTGVAELPQQSSYTPQHSGVVIDDKDDISIWQGRYPLGFAPRSFKELLWIAKIAS
jgi:hypothetical protein